MTAVGELLLLLPRRFIKLGGKFDTIINSPFVGLEINNGPASGARNTISVCKPSNGFLERVATIGRLTRELEQNQVGILVGGQSNPLTHRPSQKIYPQKGLHDEPKIDVFTIHLIAYLY